MIAWHPHTHNDRERPKDTEQRSHEQRKRLRWKETVNTCIAQPAYFDSEAFAAVTQDLLTRCSNNDEHGVADIFARKVWSIRTTETPDLGRRLWLNLALSYCAVLKKQSQKAKSRELVNKLKERIESVVRPLGLSETSRNSLYRGSLLLHAIINSLVVNQNRKLGEATILVLQYGPHRNYHYEKMTSESRHYLYGALKIKAVSSHRIARLDEICIAKMLVKLDPSLPSLVSPELIHEYFGYSFVCSTCFPESQPEPAAALINDRVALCSPSRQRQVMSPRAGEVATREQLYTNVNMYENMNDEARTSQFFNDSNKRGSTRTWPEDSYAVISGVGTDDRSLAPEGFMPVVLSSLDLSHESPHLRQVYHRYDQPLARSPVENYRIIPTIPLQYFGSSNDSFGHLLSAIKVYSENTCAHMYLAPDGTLLTPSGTKLHSDLAAFDSYCYSATIFLTQNMPDDFYQALNKACGLVRGILEAQHPRTLACFFEVFLHLIQSGHSDVTHLLREFVRDAAKVFVGSKHLLHAICEFLAKLDLASLHETISRAWECTVDTFGEALGSDCSITIAVRLDYIKRVHGAQNFAEEERLLRELYRATCAVPHISSPRIMLNLAHNLNKQGRHDEAARLGNMVLQILQKQEMYAEKIVERIEARKVIAKSYYGRRLFADAERTMRDAIDMVVQTWGQGHAWVSEFSIVLESWLRAWGREADADMPRDQIVYPAD